MRLPTPTQSPGRILAASVLVGCMSLLAGCAGEVPEVPLGPDGRPDAELELGRAVYQRRCANCHGAGGGGGTGPQLGDGAVVDEYPDVADQIAVVTDGRNGMPSFAGSLAAVEIDAVVRYTREVLG